MTPGEAACDHLKVTLKEYFDSRLVEVERRLVSLNDLNHLMAVERQHYVTRELHDRLADDLAKLQLVVTALQSRLVTWTTGVVAFNSLIVALFVYHIIKTP